MEYGLKEVDFLGVWFEHTIRQPSLLSFYENLIKWVIFDKVGDLELSELLCICWRSLNLPHCLVEIFEDLSIKEWLFISIFLSSLSVLRPGAFIV